MANVEDGGFVHTEVHSIPLKSITSQANAKDLTVSMDIELPPIANEKLFYFDVETLFGFLVSEMADISLYQGSELLAESNLHYEDESTDTMTLRLKGQTKPASTASAQKLTLKFTYSKETVDQAIALL